ncbi:ceramidase [Rhodomicrobium sp. Az07]|uniref:ceramidase domain-containing protein n=1 Tax=Rhodomicrobium sp. Az07 TaxID=2839034 RepID=UPI001BECA908|nr:ceramidase domain-containing protein [Rhodomicrobium sp. Az07]MBT3071842.1 ceramidase [Rhodomicrobium sp. Az07]
MDFGPLLVSLSRPVDIYCERTSAVFDAEPLNAISNFAFLIAAYAAWKLQARRPEGAHSAAIKALCILIGVVGIGSFVFHTIATKWAEWVDVIPILVFMIFYCWMILTVFFEWPAWLKTAACGLLFAATFYLEAEEFAPVLWGGAMYLPSLVFMVAAGAGIWMRNAAAGRAFYAAAALFVLSFTARTLDMPLCNDIPIGVHYFWHLFNATVLYLLVRTLILHAPARIMPANAHGPDSGSGAPASPRAASTATDAGIGFPLFPQN